MDFESLLMLMAHKKASDLFIIAGREPCLKMDGAIQPIASSKLSADQARRDRHGRHEPAAKGRIRQHQGMQFCHLVGRLGTIPRQRLSFSVIRLAWCCDASRPTYRSVEELHLPRYRQRPLA